MLEFLNTYANLILAGLTLLLLGVTAFYAWVTYRLLVEAAESRKAAVRPLLWVAFTDSYPVNDLESELRPAMENHGVCKHFHRRPDGVFDPKQQGKRHFGEPFLVDLEVRNNGRGPALAPHGRFVYFTADMQQCDVITLRFPNDRIDPGAKAIISDAYFWVEAEDVQKHVAIKLEITFQDAEGNLYSHERQYFAERHGKKGESTNQLHFHWFCDWEELKMWAYGDRVAAWTPELVSSHPGEIEQSLKKPRIIFHRAYSGRNRSA